MSHKEDILEAIAIGDYAVVGTQISDYFDGISKSGLSLKQPLLKEYSLFLFRFLHGIVSLKQPPSDSNGVKNVLRACIRCCEVYLTIQKQTGIDKQFGVPKLIYHILFKYREKDSQDEIYMLSELLYQMFPSDERSADAVKVIKAVYLLLWNLACKNIPRDSAGAVQLQGQVFNLLSICLKFLILLRSQSLLLERLKDISSFFLMTDAPKGGLWSDSDNSKEVTHDKICEVLEVFNSQLKDGFSSLGNHGEAEKKNSQRTLLHIRCLLTVWCMKISMFDKAREILSDIKVTNCDSLKTLSSILHKTLTFILVLDQTLKGAITANLDICIADLEFVNLGLNLMKSDNLSDLWTLHRCHYIVMQLLNKKFYQLFKGQFTYEIVDILIKYCDWFALICTNSIKLLTLEGQKTGTDGENKKDSIEVDKKKQDYIGKLYGNRLSIHYKKLELLYQLLLESLDAENERKVIDTVLETATEYTQLLTEDSSAVSDKVLRMEKYQISYICATIGKLLTSKAQYAHAGPLFKLSAHHLQQNSMPKAIRQYEVSIDCYCKQELYGEACQVILEMVEMGTEALEPAISCWTDVKQAAIEHEETLFSSMSFQDLLVKSGMELNDYTGRDLLILEYKTWKKMAERNLYVEFVLLGQMTEKSTTKVHKAEVMIELSSNLFLSGETFDDRTPGEILNKAIVMLDNCKENTQLTLAMANYRKFLVNHEEIVQRFCSTNLFEKDKKNQESRASIKDQNKEQGDVKEFRYETPFSLETEERNLPFLTRAIQLWECAFNEDLEQKKKSRGHWCIFELESHVDSMISCGTRLIAMKQPTNALRVLNTAYRQIKNIPDRKQASDLKMRTAQVLILLGQLDESEQMIGSLDSKEDSVNVEKQLLMAELFLQMGRKAEGMSLINKVLQAKKSDTMTSKTCLVTGTAKRLLSMFLCCPTGHKVTQVKQDMLSLAVDAMRQHLTVLRYEIMMKVNSKIQDKKWVLMFEFFQSLLHMCQLYRYTGLARMAECYQIEGIKLSQQVGLPLWSCEFMFEALRIHSMQEDTTKTLAAVNSIRSLLDVSVMNEVNQTLTPKQTSKTKIHSESFLCNSENEVLNTAGKMDSPIIDENDSSPHRDTQQEFDHSQLEQLSKLPLPECQCMRGKSSNDCGTNVHRLYVKAGIVISDSLTQYGMELEMNRVLSELQTKYPDYFSGFEESHKVNQNDTLQISKEKTDPQFKFLSLEAICLQAEAMLGQKKFDKVQQIWSVLHSLQSRGFWNNVVHSDVLISRVALYQASSLMLSVQSNSKTVLPCPSNKVQETKSLLDCNSSKKVNFADFISNKPEDSNRKLDEIDTEGTDPNKKLFGNNDNPLCDTKPLLTPLKTKTNEFSHSSSKLMGKLMLSAKKQKLTHVLGTPLTSRKTKLDFLMESEDDDDDDDENIVFPASKPITPKCVKPERKNRVRSRQGQNSSVDLCTDSEHQKIDSANDSDKNKIVTPKSLKPSRKKQVRSSRAQNSLDELCKTDNKHDNTNNNSSTDININLFENVSIKAGSSQANIATTDMPLQEKLQTSKQTGKKGKYVKPEKRNQEADTSISQPADLNGIVVKEQESKKSQGSKKTTKISGKQSSFKENEEVKTSMDSQSVNETESTMSVDKIVTGKSGKLTGKCVKQKLSFKGRKKAETSDLTDNCHNEVHMENKKDTVLVNGKGDDKVKKYSVLESKGDMFDFICTPEKLSNSKKHKAVKSLRKSSKTDTNACNAEKEEGKSSRKTNETNQDSKVKQRVGRRLRSDVETVRSVEENKTEEIADIILENYREIIHRFEQNEEDIGDESVISQLEDICESYCPEPFDSPQNYLSIINLPQEEFVTLDKKDCDDIEIMRGGRRQTGRKNKKEVLREPTVTRKQCCNDMEVVRSSDSANMRSVMDKMSLDCTIDIATSEATNSIQENQTVQEEEMMELLEDLCGRICHLAPYPQYPQMCQVLASKYVITNPCRAAYLLSESIAVSFRHHAAIVRNNSKHSEQSTRLSRDSVFSENVSSGDLPLYKDESSLQIMIDIIPSEWCVVQMSVISDLLQRQHFLITRLAKGKDPVVFEVPAFSTPQGKCILNDFEKVHEGCRSTRSLTDKTEWWKQRIKINTELKHVIDSMEKFWIGPWKGVFMPPIRDDSIILVVQKEIKKSLKIDIDSSKLELIMVSKKILTYVQLQSCVRGLLVPECKESDVNAIIEIINKHITSDIEITSQHHILLILDKAVQHLPWECLPVLSERSVSRMPCLSHLYYQLSYLTTQESSVYIKGANPKKLFYIVNPDGDLANTEEQFSDWFKSEEGWKGICGTKPTREQFSEALTEKDIMIYLGHGSGGRYFPGVEIEKLQGRALTVLMGCSSGKLLVRGQLEPFGIMTSYFLAGCPCMVANLWDVTDKDIDKYTMELLKTWLNSEDGSPLIPCVQRARKACKMKYLVGSAPVVYGLPVFINRKGT